MKELKTPNNSPLDKECKLEAYMKQSIQEWTK